MQCWKKLNYRLSTLHLSLQQKKNFSWRSVASEYLMWSLAFDSAITSRLPIAKKWLQVWCSCITLRLGKTDHSLEWAPSHTWSLTVTLKDTKDAGYGGGEGCKLILRDELKFLSIQGTKLFQAPLPHWWGCVCVWPGSIFLLKWPVFRSTFLPFNTGIPMGSPFKGK